MILRPPSSPRTDPLFPSTTLVLSDPFRSSPWCLCRRPTSSSIAFRELDHAAFIDRTRTILVDPAVRGREAGMNAPGVRRRAAPQGAARGLPGIEDLYRYTKDVGAGYGTEDFSFFLYALVKMHKPGRVLELGTGTGASSFWIDRKSTSPN